MYMLAFCVPWIDSVKDRTPNLWLKSPSGSESNVTKRGLVAAKCPCTSYIINIRDTGSASFASQHAPIETALHKKRQLNKLAMQVVDHLPCRFVDWKKGPANWLLTVESAAFAVELRNTV